MNSRSAQPAERAAEVGYSTQRTANLVGMAPNQVRRLARRKVVAPQKGPRGELRFGFLDLVVLREIKQALASGIGPRELLRVLNGLQPQVAPQAVLALLRVFAQHGALVERTGDQLWEVETRQGCLPFAAPAAAAAHSDTVHPMWTYLNEETGDGDDLSSDEWRQLGVDLEEVDVAKAFEAYGRALEADPGNADAHVNLGRLYQLKGNLKNAKRHYELAVQAAPGHQLAQYNLGTLFDELDEPELASRFYQSAPKVPDAHYNLARIAQRRGDELAYRRHRQNYERLLRKESR